MKKVMMIVMMLTAILTVNAFADQPEAIKFRGHEWGCSRDEILESEITPDMAEDVDYYNIDKCIELLNGTVSHFDCYTVFFFNGNDQLYEGKYYLMEDHTNLNLYYDDFVTLEDALTSLYGKPSSSKNTWSDDFYHDRPDKIGMAIAKGDVKLSRAWTAADGSSCHLYCSGDNWEIETELYYLPPSDSDFAPEDTTTTNGL